MNKVLFDIQNLNFSFGKKEILKSLSLKIYEGDNLSIIGPNGSGKTTLIKCLIRIHIPLQGKIFFNSKPIEELTQRELAKQISYVPQVSEQSFPFTAKEFLMLARYPHFSRFTSITPEDTLAVEKALEITGTTHLAERRVNTLSGGERQMIFIAAAFTQGGKIILLDEPTTFLDPKHEEDIYRILKTIHKETNRTIVTITHNINNAILYSKKIALLKNGQISFYGNSNEITENNILDKAYGKKFTYVTHPSLNKKIIIPEQL